MTHIESYRCSACSCAGRKLWRGAHDVGGWLCATCATAQERPRLEPTRRSCGGILWPFDDDGAFTFARGDHLGDMLPAVPTEDGFDVHGYGSVPSDRAQWWHSLWTYDDPALEIRSLRNIALRMMAQRDSIAKLLQDRL